MDTLRMAVIGTGLAWERLHYPAIKELGDRYQIIAVCDIDRAKARASAANLGLGDDSVYTDYYKMLSEQSDIDIVDILVPIGQNYEVSRGVAAFGIDFICEKPLAPNMRQANEYLDLPTKYGVKVLIAENYKYDEENNIIKELISQGQIGEVIYFILNNVTCFPDQMSKDTYAGTEWRQHPDFPGGAFLDAALHDIARIRHIFGAVDKVQAFGRPQSADFNPYISINANIMFKNGVIGQYNYWPSGKEIQRPLVGFRIFGTKGQIYLEEKTCGIVNIFRADGSSEQIPYRPERGYYNELLNFYNSIKKGELLNSPPEIEFGDVKMVFDILNSIRDSEVISVDMHRPAHEIENDRPGHAYTTLN